MKLYLSKTMMRAVIDSAFLERCHYTDKIDGLRFVKTFGRYKNRGK